MAEYQELPNASLSDADIVIVPIAHEETVCARGGTREAPLAILEVSEQLEFYEEDLMWSPMKYMNVCVCEGVNEYAKITAYMDSLAVDASKLLISLGGEHSITPKITASVLEKNATILFLDAHADLRESYLGSTESHATPSHHLLAQGHKMIMVGIRSIFESEAVRIKEDENIEFYGDRALQKESVQAKLLQSISEIEGDVYLSIDMDAFDPALVPGVGTPQPGGLTWYFALDIIETLFSNKNITLKGVDLVELIPEESNVSQVFAAKLMQKIISHWGKAQGFDKREMSGAQTKVEYD